MFEDKQILLHKKRSTKLSCEKDFLFLEIRKLFDESLSFVKKDFLEQDNLAKSFLEIHFKNNPVEFLLEKKDSLKENGFFIAIFFGGASLKELRDSLKFTESILYSSLSGRVAPMIDVKTAGNLLQKTGFKIPVSNSDTLEVEYNNIYHLIGHLRKLGLTLPVMSSHRNPKFNRDFFEIANKYYKKNYSENNKKIIATYELISISGWT